MSSQPFNEPEFFHAARKTEKSAVRWRSEMKDWIGITRDTLILLGIILSVVYTFMPTSQRWLLVNFGSSSHYYVGDFFVAKPDTTKPLASDTSATKETQKASNKPCIHVGCFIDGPHFRHYRWRKRYMESSTREHIGSGEIGTFLENIKKDIVISSAREAYGRTDPDNLARIDIVAKMGDCLYVENYTLTPDSSVALNQSVKKTWIMNLWIEATIVNCGLLSR